jgi:hypothetical protein
MVVAGLLELAELVVRQRRQLMAPLIEFDLLDAGGGAVGSVTQVGRDNWDKTLHPRADDETKALAATLGVPADRAYLLTPYELRSTTDEVVLRLVFLQAAKSSVIVCRPDDTELGRIRLENLLGKRRLAMEVAGTRVGAIRPESLRNKSWTVTEAQDVELAHIEMTYGSSGDRTDANDYAVHLRQPLEEPLRSLTAAAVIAVDLIVWQR